MLGKKNIKCPKCKKPIPYETLKARNGKCSYCDYVIVGNLKKFITKNTNKV